MWVVTRQIFLLLVVGVVLVGFNLDFCFGHQSPAPGHTCDHGHNHDDVPYHYGHGETSVGGQSKKLPEELAEEEDLKLYGFESTHNHNHHHHDHTTADPKLSRAGLWIHALGCSLLVSMASLICLTLLPVIFVKGKPFKAVVDSLALFGAGAMLGDAFLHQLPHAFGGQHSHGHENHHSHAHVHDHSGHAHSLKDLSIGLSILSGIVVFLIVEKVVRYVEEKSEGSNSWSHHHHHNNNNKNGKKVKDDGDAVEKLDGSLCSIDEQHNQPESGLKKRKKKVGHKDDKSTIDSSTGALGDRQPARQPSNLVFGYLNLVSDGVHNFTDGIALGSAFLLYGSVGGWSRTLFLLAHELPQEIGDFGILVRSGFSVPKAIFFNFLSALVALGGTALALLIGQDPGQSSIIEGFTAGGFLYIAVAGVLAEMNNNGSSGWKSTIMQLVSLLSGMGIALCISLVE